MKNRRARIDAKLVTMLGALVVGAIAGGAANAMDETIDIFECAGGTWHGGSEGYCACHDGYSSTNSGKSCTPVVFDPHPWDPQPCQGTGCGPVGGGGGGSGDGDDDDCSEAKAPPTDPYVHMVTRPSEKIAIGGDGTTYNLVGGQFTRSAPQGVIRVKVLNYRFYDTATNKPVNLEGLRGRFVNDAAMPSNEAIFDLEDGFIYDRAKGASWFLGKSSLFTFMPYTGGGSPPPTSPPPSKIEGGHIEGLVLDLKYDYGVLVQAQGVNNNKYEWVPVPQKKFDPKAIYGRRVLAPLSVETWVGEGDEEEDECEENCVDCKLKELAGLARAKNFAKRCGQGGGAKRAAGKMCEAELEINGDPIQQECQCWSYSPPIFGLPGEYNQGPSFPSFMGCPGMNAETTIKICGNDFKGCRDRWLHGVGGSDTGGSFSIGIGAVEVGGASSVTYNPSEGLLKGCANTANAMAMQALQESSACKDKLGCMEQ